jgi:hypothetical protein
MNDAPPVCDGCGKAERDMIETYSASGNHHYCAACWPRHRDYYEDEGGREAWKRIGNYYTPTD